VNEKTGNILNKMSSSGFFKLYGQYFKEINNKTSAIFIFYTSTVMSSFSLWNHKYKHFFLCLPSPSCDEAVCKNGSHFVQAVFRDEAHSN
jgi:hypothetical protein